MQDVIEQFLDSLRAAGNHETVRGYVTGLKHFDAWLVERGVDPLRATADDIRAFQRWLAEEYRTADRCLLGRGTQVTRLCSVKSLYQWMEKRGMVLVDPARKITLPKIPRRVTTKDYLSLQEATAMLQTQAGYVRSLPEHTPLWAAEYRNLAFLCLALATGRRRAGLRSIKVHDLNFQRDELRCEREKGKAGRVLPVAHWAMVIAREYIEQARPVLNGHSDWLFVTARSERIGTATINEMLPRVQQRTVRENPDLDELPRKHLSTHSLRVSFAKLLFDGGCNIRSINELMMHEYLGTTARYTPIPLEDLRRVCRLAHPRA